MSRGLEPKSSHKPTRTCLGCRRTDLQSNMIRLAASDEGVVPDFHRRLGGRGGYLHPRKECFEQFINAKVKSFISLKRSLTREQRITLVKQLEQSLNNQPCGEENYRDGSQTN